MVRVKRTVVLAAVVSLALSLAAQAATEPKAAPVVRAERFELVDSEGKVRAALGVTPDDQMALTMFDREGTALMQLLLAGSENGGKGGLALLDKEGQARVWIGFLPDDRSAVLVLGGNPGQPVGGLTMKPDGAVSLVLKGKEGRSEATVEVTAEGEPHLRLKGEDGRVLFEAPAPDATGEAAKRLDETNPEAVAKTYFWHLRQAQVEKAKALAVLENDAVKAEWERQVQDYVDRHQAGARPWWGDPFKVQEIPGPEGRWAVVDVQWRFKTQLGWQMGDHYAYMMRTVNGKWRMVIDQRSIDMGRPFLPEDL